MRQCTFSGCARPHEAKGLCNGHYERQRLGKPLLPLQALRPQAVSPEDWFWTKVDIRDFNGCWLWLGPVNWKGYGKFTLYKRRGISAHRYAWELLRGPIPDGHHIDHDNSKFGCHNPACCNPDHLQPVLPATNTQRRRGLQSNNTSGERGVHWVQKDRAWRGEVAFTVNGEQTKLSFSSKDRAVVSAWVVEMRERYHQ
jgi:hypothetical protein